MKYFFICLVLMISIYNTRTRQISDTIAKNKHPFFVTVTDMVFDSANSQLQISCKIFTDDFEETLRKTYPGKIDLLAPSLKNNMDSIVAAYLTRHLLIKIDGDDLNCRYIGYEKEDDAIFCYLQIDKLTEIKKIEVRNDLLFEYKPQQTNLVHITVRGIRKSARLNNPIAKVIFEF